MITSTQARAIIAAAEAQAETMGAPVNIAVLDAGAHLKAFGRMDGAVLGSIDVAAGRRMYPDGLDSVDYTSTINGAHSARLERLVADAVARGAEVRSVFELARLGSEQRMMPVLILNPPRDTLAMRDEIFGPVLPILRYRGIDDALEMIRSGPPPLALYYFGADDERARKVLDGTASGGVTINDVMTHMFVEDMPYGGIGASGMGAYRGEEGFRTFSHARAIYRQSDAKEAVELLHPPYGDAIRKFLSAAIEG